ncbi:hypothetical protein [Streptomyces sp. NPDC003480]
MSPLAGQEAARSWADALDAQAERLRTWAESVGRRRWHHTELDTDDGAQATLEAVRATTAKWPGIPHEPRNLSDAATRLSEAVHNARQRLGARADLDVEPDEDIQIFTTTLDGVRVGATGLLTALTEERDSSRDDITAAERRLFDQILTGDIRRHLAARIRQAGELVDRMNRHLERVRTASNVAVRLVWQIRPDLPEGTRTARELLLKDPGRVTETDERHCTTSSAHAWRRPRAATRPRAGRNSSARCSTTSHGTGLPSASTGRTGPDGRH